MNAATQLFMNYLGQEHDVEAKPNEIAWEGIKMYHEEIDLDLFPKEILEILPDPLLLLTASYLDEEGQEWMFCILQRCISQPNGFTHCV
ncbi:hypothetical protein [Bacillus dakarensis]|uniref:hypothetical protein n=1 Tax=Robertmurraya dakarensis TaxID=1926278 RepID=UPI00098253D0|nr:hypothetical protein [Bacillus dakarensis]